MLAPNTRSLTYVWDGVDRWGRAQQGSQRAFIEVAWVFPGVPRVPGRFGRWGYVSSGAAITADRLRRLLYFRRWFEGRVQQWDSRPLGLGGWTIDGAHLYDPQPLGHEVVYGSGERHRSDALPAQLHVIAGDGFSGNTGDGGPARDARVGGGGQVAIAPDGAIYFADAFENVVRRILCWLAGAALAPAAPRGKRGLRYELAPSCDSP